MVGERGAAIVNASIARALIRAQGMNAENARRMLIDESLAYTEQDFLNLIDEEHIGWNDVILTLNEGG